MSQPVPGSPTVLDKLVSLGKQRGFFFGSSEIYGGVNALYDYGPLGTRLRRNVRNLWWGSMIESRDDVDPIETSIIMNPQVWVASGHVDTFTDPLVDCTGACRKRWRADHLADERRARGKPDDAPGCPECGGALTQPRQFNLMFSTHLGPVADAAAQVYLRPETAQGMFVDFTTVVQAMRRRLPFGIAQQGKSFRNEISPSNSIFRTREFEQMEMEFFCKPGTDLEWHRYWCEERMRWWVEDCGVRSSQLRLRAHDADELSHYSTATSDIEYLFPWGWGELEGIADRTDFDLRRHSEHSGKDLSYFDTETNERYLPYVIEPAAGLDRACLTMLLDAWDEEEVRGDNRVVLHLHPDVSPWQLAVLPLSKKPQLTEPARALAKRLRTRFRTEYDETQSIGRRYRRQDEIGTPLAITFDFESLEDNAVTIRERDGMTQVRVPLENLESACEEQIAACRAAALRRARQGGPGAPANPPA